jgi:UDP-glucose 4-epimerase
MHDVGKYEQELIGNIGFGGSVKICKGNFKRILVTGENSYIGSSFINYAGINYPNLKIESIGLHGNGWRKMSFSGYDAVFHVAGIAHADIGSCDEKAKAEYYNVNTDLAINVCKKAKLDGVSRFVFMSSIIIYGDSVPYWRRKVIDEKTVPRATNFYGDSKLKADVAVRAMADDVFKVIVIRSPMVYGKGSKGNYHRLAKMACITPFFPNIENNRSMIYIENLCELLCQIMLIENMLERSVALLPQNAGWVKTCDMVKEIARVNGRSIWLTGLLTPFVWMAEKMQGRIGRLADKAFGNCCYALDSSKYEGLDYQKIDFVESINKTEGGRE